MACFEHFCIKIDFFGVLELPFFDRQCILQPKVDISSGANLTGMASLKMQFLAKIHKFIINP